MVGRRQPLKTGMKPSGKRHWRVEEEDQGTRKHTLAEESRPGGENALVPSSLLNFESVDAKAEPGLTAHDVLGQIQLQILG
eukprot:215701-Pelagomonas_calceolata.AAC.1